MTIGATIRCQSLVQQSVGITSAPKIPQGVSWRCAHPAVARQLYGAVAAALTHTFRCVSSKPITIRGALAMPGGLTTGEVNRWEEQSMFNF